MTGVAASDTAARAVAGGATVVTSPDGPRKGQALEAALAATTADVVVFLDADVVNFTARYVTALLEPLLLDENVQLAKAAYRRPLHGRTDEGGRVTELLARPLLRRLAPDLADVAQPLAGECAVRRRALDGLRLSRGYGIEIGLLLDVVSRFGRAAVTDVDLGERVHRNRPLQELRAHADDIVAAVFDRCPPSPDRGEQP